MIFVTVGTDSHFDRMIRVIDQWVAENERKDVFAQIGQHGWEPTSMPFSRLIDPAEFKKRFTSADIIIGHAGMGTILSALNFGKPILVMPKKASLGEHRNEHQMATARNLLKLGKVNVAFDEAELRTWLGKIDTLVPKDPISPYASGGIIDGLREYIATGSTDRDVKPTA